MNIKLLVNALRFGQAIGAKSQWRWAGAVGLVAGFGFYVAKTNGLLSDVEIGQWMELVEAVIDLGLAVSVYSAVATTEKVGLLPKAKQEDPDVVLTEEDIREALYGDRNEGDFADNVDFVRDTASGQRLSTDTHETDQYSKSSGFPSGPFWDNSR